METALAIEVRDLVKDYRGLRPLRVSALDVPMGASVALAGLDAAAAEVFVNLLTGFVAPDAGEVRVLSQSTGAIGDGEAWLASLDRLGLVTPRHVLLGELTVRQNLALPFTVAIDPLDDEARRRADRLGERVGLSGRTLDEAASGLSSFDRARLHLARSMALGPRLLLLEHPTLELDPPARARFGALVSAVRAAQPGLTVLAITEDRAFADALGARALTLAPGTGRVSPRLRGWRFWQSS